MERIPTSFTSEDLDQALKRILAEPTWAHRMLHAAARVLEEQPFLVMNYGLLTDALNEAKDQVCAGLPDVVVEKSTELAMTAVPAVREHETAGEYALRLHAAAGCV
jgi:hypothetical protein